VQINLSMFLLTISVGRIWSVQSVLEFSAIKTNLSIMSDIERVFWTVLFHMASRLFFLYPERLNLVRCKKPRTLRWFMKPRWELAWGLN